MREQIGTDGLEFTGEPQKSKAQLLRQGDAKVFKKYSQMKLQMKREALEKIKAKGF